MVEETQSIFIHLLKSPQVIYIFCCLSGKDGKGKTKGKQEHSDYLEEEWEIPMQVLFKVDFISPKINE